VTNLGIPDQEPVGEISLFVDDPEERIEKWTGWCADGAGASLVCHDKRPGKELMLRRRQRVWSDGESRRKVGDERHRLAVVRCDPVQGFGEKLWAGCGATIRTYS
jgi:hypothetical protein